MDSLDFSEEEIQEQLAALGYKNIPKHRLLEFKQDLAELLRCGEWRNFASSTQMNSKSEEATSRQGPPAFTKEKVGQCYFDGSSEKFFLHADKADSGDNRDCRQGHCDSYAQYTVAAKLQLPPGAPTRLHVEPDLENTLQSPVSDSCTSSPDSHGRRFIKRKVLRKHKGQLLVCDESVYSEDSALCLHRSHSGGVHVATMYKMYDTQWDKDSDNDKNSLSSSFWSDGEKQEEEEEKVEVLIQRRTDSRAVNNAEDSPKEASPEEKAELNNQKNVTAVSLEEEEVQVEGFIHSKPVNNAEDSHKEASEEEKSEQDNQGTSTADSYQEESGDEDEQDEEEGFNDEEEEEEVDEEEEDGDDDEEEDGEDEEDNEEEEDIDDMEEDEEDVQTKGVIDSKPDSNGENSLIDAPEEERSVLKNQGSTTGESLKEDSEEEEEEEEGCSTSSDSPAPSLMTSGYGTYRPEEGGDYRDDHTITEFDQDSRGDLSEMRDDEEDNRSLCSFVEFDIEPTHEAHFSETTACVLEDNKIAASPHEESCRANVKAEEGGSADENPEDLCISSENEVANGSLEEQQPHAITAEEKLLLKKVSKDASDIKEDGKTEEEQGFHKMKNVQKETEESEDPDESSSNKDIKFIDSKVDFSWMTYDKMCVEWEGNFRQKKDAASCLEEQLAELHLSTSAPQDSEAEEEDVRDHSDTQSSETDGISLSAFESYIRGMTRTQSDGDLRPRHKSFIRPVMRQQTFKKTDPVAKYFQYKQLWNMFKLPGEKDRRSLRWEIKERLAYQPPPPKPRKVFVPNTYIVPTEKKRSALRWEVRNDLANGLLPHKLSYRF